jgi:hypothetical protein
MMMDKLGVTSLAQLIQIKLNSDLSSRLLSYRSSDLVPST